MKQNEIVAEAFDLATFKKALTQASGGAQPFVTQIDYLARYCARLGAATVVREKLYIDRHFLDEYALYYSRNLSPPPNRVQRFHLFSRSFTDDGLTRLFEDRAKLWANAGERFDARLSASYLGFVSIRPLPSVPVGRTVLRQLDDGQPRDIWATSKHPVHLGNLTLTVEGIAFQQQDVAVGACATAALWSALSRVSRHEGMRAPTPAEVSEAAARHLLPHGRTLPAVAGLTVAQLAEAIRTLGFAPEAVRANELPEIFVVALHTYLLSGIPVVLALRSADGGHAVTAVGFQTTRKPKALLQTTVPVRSARIEKIYVHDDRLGPYARSFLRPVPRTATTDEALVLEIETASSIKAEAQANPKLLETWLVDSCLVPVYPKLRLPVRSLITIAELLADLLERIVGARRAPRLSVEFYYERSGTYLTRLNGRLAGSAAPFLRSVALPRWCGVVRWFLSDAPLAEFVYDTTDILRDGERLGAELLRAVVCLNPRFKADFAAVGRFLGVPAA